MSCKITPEQHISPGGWEEHTRGVGSRLMLAMGWQAGSGLGRSAGGRVDPVEARIYPQVFPYIIKYILYIPIIPDIYPV